MFKKKLLDTFKNNNSPKKSPSKGAIRSESESSDEEISDVLELSHSDILSNGS